MSSYGFRAPDPVKNEVKNEPSSVRQWKHKKEKKKAKKQKDDENIKRFKDAMKNQNIDDRLNAAIERQKLKMMQKQLETHEEKQL